ncbi:PREDICTED: uncharacterized protein LOC101297562 [Fragaria vesca subsp. vesca]
MKSSNSSWALNMQYATNQPVIVSFVKEQEGIPHEARKPNPTWIRPKFCHIKGGEWHHLFRVSSRIYVEIMQQTSRKLREILTFYSPYKFLIFLEFISDLYSFSRDIK